MKRLLLVAYYFPPLAGSGVFRPLRMSRYLPKNGWDVTVLTAAASVRVLKDPGLLEDVPAEVTVARARSIEPRNALIVLNRLGMGGLARTLEPWFAIPDDQRGWVPFATRRALALHAAHPFDAVVATAGPYSALLVGQALKRRAGIPFVADFRDEWTTNPYLAGRYPTAWHLHYNRALERGVLEDADRVVCVSRPWLDAIRALAPDQPEAKFEVHENGYDAAHFEGEPAGRADKFRIVYAGTFYGHRQPKAFLEAVRLLLSGDRIPASDLEILFVGHGSERPGEGLPDAIFKAAPQRPFHDALREMTRAAVLLLVIPREGGPGNHTGKIFNYLAAARPILCLAPEPNVAASLVRESRSGLVAPPDDPAAIADALVALWRDWKDGRVLPDRRPEVVSRYEAGVQAARYSAMIAALREPILPRR
jgi:glycosyltransferase involved in cell wall biosynthesis